MLATRHAGSHAPFQKLNSTRYCRKIPKDLGLPERWISREVREAESTSGPLMFKLVLTLWVGKDSTSATAQTKPGETSS